MQEMALYDIYGFVKTPLWQTTFFYVVIISIALVLFLFLLYFCFVKIIKKRAMRLEKPWQRAYRIINQYDQSGDPGTFYVMLTITIKEYFSHRYATSVTGKTDEEFLEYLKRTEVDADIQEHMRLILQSAVYAKFAECAEISENLAQDKDRAITIIRNTMPEHEQI